MLQLAYVSRASSVLAPDDVFKIIETSARNNSRDDLTGFLIFAENRFFQVVEGSRSAIDALLSRLGEDTRHSQIEILSQTGLDDGFKHLASVVNGDHHRHQGSQCLSVLRG